ncbi:hypothetical protein ILYODFUR_035107 [Ilyodon furcidens]|uniref:Uncharacterized protein n=1 Tax=Ilyodon furcidens TaxID=33524 RepID=A0ABV0UAY5_9TELE
MCGLSPSPHHTPCWWLVSLPAGLLVVLGAGCSGECCLTPSGSLAGPGPSVSVRPLLRGGVPLGLRSLGPWLDRLQRSQLSVVVTAAPWGFCTVAAGWFPWGPPPLFFSA